MKVYRCDRCLEIYDKASEMNKVSIEYMGFTKQSFPRDGTYHVCGKCVHELLLELNAFGKGGENEKASD